MISITFLRVSSFTYQESFKTLDIVAQETPASFAISLIFINSISAFFHDVLSKIHFLVLHVTVFMFILIQVVLFQGALLFSDILLKSVSFS